MKRLHGTVSGALTAGFIGFLSFGHPAFAEQVSRQQILEGLTVQPKVASFSDKLRLTRSMTFNDRDYEVTNKAEPQLDELGAALSDPQLKGASISINGHTDGVGGDAFNKKLSERRAAMIKP